MQLLQRPANARRAEAEQLVRPGYRTEGTIKFFIVFTLVERRSAYHSAQRFINRLMNVTLTV